MRDYSQQSTEHKLGCIFFLIVMFLLLQLDTSGNGYIDLKELKDALDGVGYKIPQWKVRKLKQ